MAGWVVAVETNQVATVALAVQHSSYEPMLRKTGALHAAGNVVGAVAANVGK